MTDLFNRDGSQPPAVTIHQGKRPFWVKARSCTRCGGAVIQIAVTNAAFTR